MPRRIKTRGESSKLTKQIDKYLLAASQTAEKMAEGAELSIGDEMINTIRTEVKALQAEIMAEFRATALTMREEVVKELRSTLTSLQTTVADHANKISALEDSQNDVTDRLAELETRCASLASDNIKLKAAVDNQENRSRRQNLRIVGLPEGEEGNNPTAFMGPFLRELLGEGALTTTPVVDRAHRTFVAKPPPGQPPRAMLVRLHYYQTKERILRAFRERSQLSYHGKRIHIFPDYSAALARRRAEFKVVKAQLHQAGVKFGLIYPAKLRLTFQGSTHTFDSPEAALLFCRTSIQPATERPGDRECSILFKH